MKRLLLVFATICLSFIIVSCGNVSESDVPVNELVYIPAGNFVRGSNDVANESPESVVSLQKYFIDANEVSNAQYKYFVDMTGHSAPSHWVDGNYEIGKDDYAVVNVTWEDSSAYCAWVGKRLPTEEEWEKAARGPYGNTYPWGEEAPNDTIANYNYNIGETASALNYPGGVSYYGIYNMAGNVWEWTSSWYKGYAGGEDEGNPDYDETYKVLKGGGWNSSASSLRSSTRGRMAPVSALDTVGFRCAK